MLEKFIPAKMPAAIAALIPGRQMTLDCRVMGTPNSAGPLQVPGMTLPGPNLTALPQIAPPAPQIGVPVPQIPKSSDIAVRINPKVPVPSPPQPTAGNIGSRYALAPSGTVRAISTEFPVQAEMPVGGLGQNAMALLATRAGSEASMQGFGADSGEFVGLRYDLMPKLKISKANLIAHPAFTMKSPDAVEEETPWLMYAAYGAAGVAVLGLGYVLLSKPPKARANARRRRGTR